MINNNTFIADLTIGSSVIERTPFGNYNSIVTDVNETTGIITVKRSTGTIAHYSGYTQSIINYKDLNLNDEKRKVSISGENIDLTYKEYELLRYLLVNKGIVLSREKIMDYVWGTDFMGESRTLDMHIKTLRKKLGEYGDIIRTIRNVGYIVEWKTK